MSARRPSTPDPRLDVQSDVQLDALPPSDSACLDRLRDLAADACSKRVHLFVSHAAHFLDPLVPEDFESLRSAPISEEVVAAAARVVETEACADDTPRIYFPVPMARMLAAGSSWKEVEGRFRYDMIIVDEEQRWTWRGSPVADRTREFFTESLAWQPTVGRWFFEYKIHDGWWDKSYLEAEVTPLRALHVEASDDAGGAAEAGELRLVLPDGRRVAFDPDSLQLDGRERLFVDSAELGQVLFADAERFRILRTADEDLETVDLAGRRVRLRWPADD